MQYSHANCNSFEMTANSAHSRAARIKSIQLLIFSNGPALMVHVHGMSNANALSNTPHNTNSCDDNPARCDFHHTFSASTYIRSFDK